MTEEQMRAEGEARKVRSIERLSGEGVPTIEHLPWIECDPASIRHLEAVARRVTVIGLMAVHAETDGMPRNELEKYLDARDVRRDLTAGEREFLEIPNPTKEDRGPFTWQYECANVLLWAMGFVDLLGPPTKYCSASEVSAIIAPRDLTRLTQESKFRSAAEIFDQTDLIFRYHWAARNSYLRGQAPPAGLIVPVCHYRHYALNWLTDCSADWDNVDTST